ncbi:hypothetical protein ACIQ7Q_31915 [Streptomyces sp. NPDC096176]|uniref:hypothetical protein n=1 Tax=Streptomyces sp. NPDC096176 TaxID=3366079 RepID=UPI00382DE1AA
MRDVPGHEAGEVADDLQLRRTVQAGGPLVGRGAASTAVVTTRGAGTRSRDGPSKTAPHPPTSRYTPTPRLLTRTDTEVPLEY